MASGHVLYGGASSKPKSSLFPRAAAPRRCARRAAVYNLIALARIVGRINVDDALRPHPMQLHDGVLGEPSIMLHTFWRVSKPSGLMS